MENGGLAYWAGAGGGLSEEAAVTAMRAHPHFADAMRRAIAGSLELFGSDPVSMRAMKNMNRQAMGFFALYLDASGDLTLARVQQLCVDLRMMSPGRAVTMLAQLRLLRYIEPAAEQRDRRKRCYVPTATLRQVLLSQLRMDLAALALIEPEAQEVAVRLDETEVSRKFITRFGERLIAAIRGYEQQNTAADLFPERQAGLMILNTLMLAGAAGDTFPPAGPIPVSIASLARRFGVSRPHVRKLLRDAERGGLLHRDGEEGPCVLAPILREKAISYHARSLVGIASCAHAALAGERPDYRPGAYRDRTVGLDL